MSTTVNCIEYYGSGLKSITNTTVKCIEYYGNNSKFVMNTTVTSQIDSNFINNVSHTTVAFQRKHHIASKMYLILRYLVSILQPLFCSFSQHKVPAEISTVRLITFLYAGSLYRSIHYISVAQEIL